VNPFSDAGKVFAEFLESDRRSKQLLVSLAALLFILLIVSQFTIAWMYSERKEHLSIVEVDGATGAVVRKYTPVAYTPTAAQKSYVARQWVKSVRRRPSDKIVMRDDILWAYAHTAGAARDLLDKHFRAGDPFAEEDFRTIEELSSLKKSEDSFQVTWTEATFSPSGAQRGSVEHTALITVAHGEQAVTDDTQNPTNLHVVFFDWTVPEVLPR
jgi:type IV secretory pathway TrbF-like protein